MMKKIFVPLFIVPLFLVGCGKNKDVYASSKNTIFSYELNGKEAIITGFSDNYKDQTEIIIPYSIDKHVVKSIKASAFNNQNRIKNIDMTKSKLTTIEDNAFSKCSGLVDIKYGKTIETIGKEAFSECDNLESMDLSNVTVMEISDGLFKKCSKLANVKFPSTAKILGSNIFEGCDTLTNLDFSDTSFETFNENSLSNLKNLSKVVLPNTLKEIKTKAFYNDRKLQVLDLSKTNVETIGDSAFSNCRIIETINVSPSLKTIGKEAFYYCEKLKKMDLSNTKVGEIPESAFELCANLSTINLSQVSKIDSKAFYNSGISKIVIPVSTSEIADDAFVFCRKLKSIEVAADNPSYKDKSGVLYTKDLKKLIAYPALKEDKLFICPAETESINAYAFAEAMFIETADLRNPLGLSIIDDYTFMNCASLEKVLIDENSDYSIKKIGIKAFFGCKSLLEFDALSSVIEIGESAFYDCVSLGNVELKNAPVKTIGVEAFYNCGSINYLSLPSSLESIGRSAFYGCNKMETIIYTGSSSKLQTLITNNSECGLKSYYDSGKIQHN